MCQLWQNLGASNSWNPQGLSRPVTGLLYLTYLRLNPQNSLFLSVSSAKSLNAFFVSPDHPWFDVLLMFGEG
jgi:hypothetical protein